MITDLHSIAIRTELAPGDLGYVAYLHGSLYAAEYQYGIEFESYVAAGLLEFYRNNETGMNRVWLCEHGGHIVGTLFRMHRENNAAQLRYFLIEPRYRGIGLGKKLMDLFMESLHQSGYRSAYLWTTHELKAAASLYKRHGFELTEEKISTTFGKPVTEQRYDLHRSL